MKEYFLVRISIYRFGSCENRNLNMSFISIRDSIEYLRKIIDYDKSIHSICGFFSQSMVINIDAKGYLLTYYKSFKN